MSLRGVGSLQCHVEEEEEYASVETGIACQGSGVLGDHGGLEAETDEAAGQTDDEELDSADTIDEEGADEVHACGLGDIDGRKKEMYGP